MHDLGELEIACNVSVQDSLHWPSGPGRSCWTQVVTSSYENLTGTGLLISARWNSVLCETSPLSHKCLFSWTTLLLWEVAGVVPQGHWYIPLSVGLQWYCAVRYGGWMGILQWDRTVCVQLWTIVHKHSMSQALVATNHTTGKGHHSMLPYAGWNHTDPPLLKDELIHQRNWQWCSNHGALRFSGVIILGLR